MRSLFELSLRSDPFGRRLSQDDQTVQLPPMEPADNGIDWGNLFEDIVDVGQDIYKGWTAAEIAEDQRKKAEAEAAAARARATGATPSTGMVLGIPTNYLIYGGIGLVGLALVVGLLGKK